MPLTAIAATTFGPGGDAPRDVDNIVTLMLPSQRPMIFQDSEVEMHDRVGVLETAVGNDVDHGFPPELPRCRAIPFFARTLTFSVGRFWATHLHAWSL